ncbi:unnamed protein product, partial [Diamesa serratosioi]
KNKIQKKNTFHNSNNNIFRSRKYEPKTKKKNVDRKNNFIQQKLISKWTKNKIEKETNNSAVDVDIICCVNAIK